MLQPAGAAPAQYWRGRRANDHHIDGPRKVVHPRGTSASGTVLGRRRICDFKILPEKWSAALEHATPFLDTSSTMGTTSSLIGSTLDGRRE